MSATELQAAHNAAVLGADLVGDTPRRAVQRIHEMLDFYTERDVDWPLVVAIVACGYNEHTVQGDVEFLEALIAERRKPRLEVVP